ncbi:MAG: CusA/CzcA family heavy metal efflux RND transporter [Betaproteobacteria bacterium]|nr:CusA/CzcA family heavy metal efflux RND transporter [Betaproteobacteria bacterium]
MIERLVTFALQQRMFVIVIAVIVAIAGGFAWTRLPIEAFPDVQDVQVLVVTQYPGKAPEEVERSISIPIEKEMTGVAHLSQVRSVSMFGLSVVTVTFADGTDDYFARQQVNEKLQTVALPPGVTAALGPLTNAVGEIYRYVVQAPPDMPLTEVRALQDWVIRPALRRAPGVVDVVSFGGAVKEYQVRVDPQKLRKNNVTLDQVAAALAANSDNTGGGLMRRGDESLFVRAVGLYRSIDDISRVVVVARNGAPVFVGDVATVAVGERPRSGIVAFNDQDSVVEGVVNMTKGWNATRAVEALKQSIDALSHRLPSGVKLVPFYDRTELVKHTVHTVTENLAVGAALIVTILLVFLRNWRAAVIVACVIPMSLLTAFVLMDLRGVSANLISLGSVDFGIIVDSAVVLVEALMVKLAAGQLDDNVQHQTYAWRMHALRGTAVSLGSPILFSKAIIILAFLPIFTFQRVEGKIFSPMAYTLSFALAGAILITLTLIPALLSFTMRSSDMAERHSAWMDAARSFYRRLLGAAWQHRAAVIAGSVGILAVSLLGAGRLGSEFLPKLDEGNLWLTITLPPSSALDKTKEVERAVRAILRSYPEVNNVVTQVGRPDDGTDPKGPNNLEILADLKPRATWRFPDKDAMIEDMSRKIRAMPGVPTNFSQVIQDNVEEALSGVKGEIAVKIFGPDLDILEDKGEQVASILAGVPGSTDVAAIKVGGASELTVTLDREKMARYGLNVAAVNRTFNIALGGAVVNAFYEGNRSFDVTVRLDAPYREAADDVAALPIALPGGNATIPLGEIANIEIRQGAARISRESGGRTVAVKANLLGRDQGSFVAEAREKVDAQVKLPPGYSMTWGGQFENQQRAVARLKIIVPLSVLGIFILLFWAFRSLATALLILAMIPFTLIGGLAALALAGLHLSISAAVGFIAVAGISVQNGVIMVERFLESLRNGVAVESAVQEGAVDRLRPIVMTALMAGLGLLPAALSHGIGSETQRPFAVVIVGGIVSATIFALVLLPLMYSLIAERYARVAERTESTPSAMSESA